MIANYYHHIFDFDIFILLWTTVEQLLPLLGAGVCNLNLFR